MYKRLILCFLLVGTRGLSGAAAQLPRKVPPYYLLQLLSYIPREIGKPKEKNQQFSPEQWVKAKKLMVSFSRNKDYTGAMYVITHVRSHSLTPEQNTECDNCEKNLLRLAQF